MQRLTPMLIVGLVLAGCGGSGDDAHCDTAGSARLCLVDQGGSYTVEAKGLEPGSEVGVEVAGERWAPVAVSDDGSIAREGGVLGLLGIGGSEITIGGVAAGGQVLRVTVNG